METTKRLTILLIAAILATNPIQAAEQSSEKLSETRLASCLVKVTCDPMVLPLSFATIDYLLQSSGVGGKAAREALDVSPDQVQDIFTIEYIQELASDAIRKPSRERSSGYDENMSISSAVPAPRPSRVNVSSGRTRNTSRTGLTITAAPAFPANEQTYLFSLNIKLPEEVKPAAEEFMDALLLNLRNALGGTSDEHRQKLRKQDALADEEAHRAEAELRNLQERLLAISGSRILDRNRILLDIEELRNEIQKIEMEMYSDEINVEATTKRIHEIQDKMQKEIAEDTVTRELAELLSLQRQNFQNVEKLYRSKQSSSAEFADAQEKLVRSKIELEQRREQLRKSAGGNLIESLNSTLANYSISTTQNKLKLERLSGRLAEAEDLLKKADDYEMVSLKVDIAKQNLQETILWRDRISRQIRMIQPPMVSVIGGD